MDAGYQPEIAYFEACHELKLIGGPDLRGRIHAHVEQCIQHRRVRGGMTRGQRIINEESRAEMQEILSEIQSGEFAREWILESQAGMPVKKSLEKMEAEHPIETVGAGAAGHDALAAKEANFISWEVVAWRSDGCGYTCARTRCHNAMAS